MSETDYYAWQHKHWAEHAAEWEKWAEAVAPQAEAFNRPIIDGAGIKAGSRVLDLACGAGEPALTAAEAAGPTGHVTATDYAPEMVAVTERRAQAKGVANMAFRQADMAALPFDDASFDAVISRFGFMYTEAPDRCAAEILRVLRPGGKVAMMVWGPMDNNTALKVALNAANDALKWMDQAATEHSAVFAPAGVMSGIFSRAGFAEANEQDFHFEPRIPEKVRFWQPIVGMNLGAAMRGLGQDEVKALDDKIRAAHAPYLRDGKYHMKAHIRLLTATKPG